MNTIDLKLNSKSSISILQKEWKSRANRKINNSTDMLDYIALNCILRREQFDGPDTLARLKKAFPPIVNLNKLSNGRKPYDTLMSIIHIRSWRIQNRINVGELILGIELTEEMKKNYINLLNWCSTELRMERKI